MSDPVEAALAALTGDMPSQETPTTESLAGPTAETPTPAPEPAAQPPAEVKAEEPKETPSFLRQVRREREMQKEKDALIAKTQDYEKRLADLEARLKTAEALPARLRERPQDVLKELQVNTSELATDLLYSDLDPTKLAPEVRERMARRQKEAEKQLAMEKRLAELDAKLNESQTYVQRMQAQELERRYLSNVETLAKDSTLPYFSRAMLKDKTGTIEDVRSAVEAVWKESGGTRAVSEQEVAQILDQHYQQLHERLREDTPTPKPATQASANPTLNSNTDRQRPPPETKQMTDDELMLHALQSVGI